jgi:DNA-binding YbaB/EbfC family protein
VIPNFGDLDFGKLLGQVGQMREAMQKATEALANLQVEGSAGGGVVTARANGRMELLGVRIDPKLLADGDAELLEDLVTAAVNQALSKARDEAARSFQGLGGGLPLPDLSALFKPGT